MASDRMWEFRAGVGIVNLKRDLVVYNVESSDGRSLGKIDKSGCNTVGAYLVVDTRSWTLGKKRLIPAGFLERVDVEAEKVFVDLSKTDIKGAPDFDRRHCEPPLEHEKY